MLMSRLPNPGRCSTSVRSVIPSRGCSCGATNAEFARPCGTSSCTQDTSARQQRTNCVLRGHWCGVEKVKRQTSPNCSLQTIDSQNRPFNDCKSIILSVMADNGRQYLLSGKLTWKWQKTTPFVDYLPMENGYFSLLC